MSKFNPNSEINRHLQKIQTERVAQHAVPQVEADIYREKMQEALQAWKMTSGRYGTDTQDEIPEQVALEQEVQHYASLLSEATGGLSIRMDGYYNFQIKMKELEDAPRLQEEYAQRQHNELIKAEESFGIFQNNPPRHRKSPGCWLTGSVGVAAAVGIAGTIISNLH